MRGWPSWAVAIALVPVRWIRSALAGSGVALAAYAVTFELAGPYLTAALIDRLTEASHVFNMKDCVSLRTKMTES